MDWIITDLQWQLWRPLNYVLRRSCAHAPFAEVLHLSFKKHQMDPNGGQQQMSWLGKELTAASATGAEQDPRPQRGKTDQKFIAQESQEVMKHDETNPCLLDRASPEPATEEQVVKRLRCVCHQSAFRLSHLHSDMLPACPRQKANKNSFGFDQRFTAWSSQKLLQRLQSLIL